MTTLAHRSALRRTEQRRRRRPPRRRPLGVAHVPPRVAAADPGGDAPHRRRRGRDRQHHDRLQHGSRRRRRVRLGQRSCSTFDGSDPRKLEAGLDVRRGSRSGRSTSSATARCPSPAASRRWTSGRRTRDGAYGGELLALRRGSYPAGPRPGRRHRRGGGAPAARDRVDPGPRRPATDRRRHRREPAQAERRVRSRLPLVRRSARTRSPFSSTRATRRSTPSCDSLGDRSARPSRAPWHAAATSAARRRRWRCSPWPPSSCSWPRSLPPQASQSSRSDGSASSACSPPSAPRRSTSGSCC